MKRDTIMTVMTLRTHPLHTSRQRPRHGPSLPAHSEARASRRSSAVARRISVCSVLCKTFQRCLEVDGSGVPALCQGQEKMDINLHVIFYKRISDTGMTLACIADVCAWSHGSANA